MNRIKTNIKYTSIFKYYKLCTKCITNISSYFYIYSLLDFFFFFNVIKNLIKIRNLNLFFTKFYLSILSLFFIININLIFVV